MSVDACTGLSFISEEVRKHHVPGAAKPAGFSVEGTEEALQGRLRWAEMEQRVCVCVCVYVYVCVLAVSTMRSESQALALGWGLLWAWLPPCNGKRVLAADVGLVSTQRDEQMG